MGRLTAPVTILTLPAVKCRRVALPVAPHPFGADTGAGMLLMEDLGEGAPLAASLLAGGRERVQAELIANAQALGSCMPGAQAPQAN